MARRRLVLLGVSALVVAAACANDAVQRPSPAAGATTTVVRTTIPIPTTTLPDLTASDGLAASIRQFREDEAVDVIQVEVTRASPPDGSPPSTDLTNVVSVQLDWPGFTKVPPTQRPVAVAAGQRVDLPTPLGAVVCDTADTPDVSLGHVNMVVHLDGAPDRTVQAPLLADAQVALDNVHTKGCVREHLLEKVGLTYMTPWVRSDPGGVPTGSADLVVTRKGTTEPIVVTGVDGSVLLFVNPVGQLSSPASTVAVGAATASIPIVVTGAGRCDGHALSDSKRTYVFQILVKVGDDEPVGVDLPVPDVDRPLLNQVIVDTCGSDHRR